MATKAKCGGKAKKAQRGRSVPKEKIKIKIKRKGIQGPESTSRDKIDLSPMSREESSYYSNLIRNSRNGSRTKKKKKGQ